MSDELEELEITLGDVQAIRRGPVEGDLQVRRAELRAPGFPDGYRVPQARIHRVVVNRQ